MDLIKNIKGKPFVVFGRAGIDLFADPVGTSAEGAETFCSDLGGSSANICVGLCKLGHSSSLVTSLSDDVVGRFCFKRLQHYGVDTKYIICNIDACELEVRRYLPSSKPLYCMIGIYEHMIVSVFRVK